MLFVSVDVEASGPLPGYFDLLSIGAVPVRATKRGFKIGDETFYVELKPVHGTADAGAMKVNKLDLAELTRSGVPIERAAKQMKRYLRALGPPRDPPVFVGYCANFDWAFMNDFFHRAGVTNPFGYKALDIRSLALGVLPLGWHALKQDKMLPLLGLDPLSEAEAHNALADARHQARMLVALLERGALAQARE